MRLFSFFLSLIFLLPFAVAAQQTRSDLEKRRQQIVESLKETQAQLEATKSDKKATMSQLNALQAKLRSREKLIGNINLEMSNLDNDIRSSSTEVEHLRSNLKTQQIRYAQSVRYAYANRSSYNTLAFIFSAKDFTDAMRRLKYMKKYRDFRKGQVDAIKTTQNKIEQKINVLSIVKNQKGQLLTAEEQQKLVLQQERSETNKVVEELKGREKELTSDIENKRKVTRRLDNAISEAIRKEIEIARKKAEEEERRRKAEEERKAAALAAAKAAAAADANTYGSGANKVTLAGSTPKYNVPNNPTPTKPAPEPTATKPAGKPAPYNPVAATIDRSPTTNTSKNTSTYAPTATPESAELSKGFEENRGRLPWPVANGVVVDAFGKHKHAVATKVEIDNNGIDIQTSQGAKARAVFEGNVTSVLSMVGVGSTIIVNHGKYFTVYSGLTNVTVKKGDNIATKQNLGTVINNEDGVAVMNFQVWRGADKMNPSGWISPM